MVQDTQDQQQVVRLCDDLTARLVSGQAEESLLSSLEWLTARAHAYQSRQYHALLEAVRTRQRRWWELFYRYCRDR